MHIYIYINNNNNNIYILKLDTVIENISVVDDICETLVFALICKICTSFTG